MSSSKIAVKKSNKDSQAASAAEVGLRYHNTNGGWGLAAEFEDKHLVFSGDFNRGSIWQKITDFFIPSKLGKDIDIYNLFSKNAKNAWNQSYEIAKKQHRDVGEEAIFLALIRESSVQNLLTRMKVDVQAAEKLISNYLMLRQIPTPKTVKKIPFEAFKLAVKLRGHKIGSLMLLGALLNATPEENILQAIFSNAGLTIDKLEVLTVWIVNLGYEFPDNSKNAKLLYCCLQAESLEEHFGYFFEFPAIEAAVNLSSGQSLKDLEHKKALQILVRAGSLARAKGTKVITEGLVRQAAF